MGDNLFIWEKVMALLVQGKTNSEIAKTLGLTSMQVKNAIRMCRMKKKAFEEGTTVNDLHRSHRSYRSG